ncbi:DUF456 domain-containing protein [Patescibacteria group bacterium]|nr:DUF456 domain-containing protein [Patescibacteria group bacterium]
MIEVVAILATIILILAGFAGLFVPYLPDAPLVFGGILLFAIADGFGHVHPVTIVVLGLITLFVTVIDLVAAELGVKKLGGSTLAMVLSIAGGIVGVIGWNIAGLIAGTFLGALLGELIKTGDIKQSIKVSVGSLLGFLAGTLFKVIVMVIMVGVFVGALIV